MTKEKKTEFKMDNRAAIATFKVLEKLKEERGLPIKFGYAVGKLKGRLKNVKDSVEEFALVPVEGQEDYNNERNALLRVLSDKDDKGNPITFGQGQYQITDWGMFHSKIGKLDKKHAKVLAEIKARKEKYDELLNADAEDFEPYDIEILWIPVDKQGQLKITVEQFHAVMPFLVGEIEDLPDYEEE